MTKGEIVPASSSDPPLDGKSYFELYRIYRGYVMEESGLINSRLNWIITINGFLYTSFAFTLQKLIDVVRGFNNPQLKHQASTIFIDTMIQTNIFLIILSVVGIIIGVYGHTLIRTAQQASNSVDSVFQDHVSLRVIKKDKKIIGYELLDGVVLPHIRGGGDPFSVVNSHKTSRRIPVMFAWSWVLSLFVLITVWFGNTSTYGELSNFRRFFVTESTVTGDIANSATPRPEERKPAPPP